MPGFDPEVGVEWVIDALNASAAIQALPDMGARIYAHRDVVPFDVPLPAIAVFHSATKEAWRPLKTQRQGQAWTPITVTAKVVSADAYRPDIADAIINLLDSELSITTADGFIYDCIEAAAPPMYTEIDGNATFRHIPTLWNINVKSN